MDTACLTNGSPTMMRRPSASSLVRKPEVKSIIVTRSKNRSEAVLFPSPKYVDGNIRYSHTVLYLSWISYLSYLHTSRARPTLGSRWHQSVSIANLVLLSPSTDMVFQILSTWRRSGDRCANRLPRLANERPESYQTATQYVAVP